MQIDSKIIFIGKMRIRYRWRAIKFALLCLTNAFKGYETSIETHYDESIPDNRPLMEGEK